MITPSPKVVQVFSYSCCQPVTLWSPGRPKRAGWGRASSPARLFLRHLASDQNRNCFLGWEQVQLVLGLLLLVILFFGTDARPPILLAVLLMTLVVALMHWLMTPEIIKLGRAIEFVPDAKDSVERSRFWGFHTAYATIDVVKTVLASLVAIRLVSISTVLP